MIKSEAITLQRGDLVTVRRSGKTYRVNNVRPNDEELEAVQLRDGKTYGPIRFLQFAAVDRLSTADDRHPASQALTAILQPPAQDLPLSEVGRARLAERTARAQTRNDGDEGDRLARRVVRAAERWQARFPCPEAASDPELAAIWRAVENLLAHDNPMPATRAGKLSRVRALVPVPLTDHGDRLTTTADALTEAQALAAFRALDRIGARAARERDQDGRWSVTIWI